MTTLAKPVPTDIPGLWDLYRPDGTLFAGDLTTMQVVNVAHEHGWLLPEPSHSERADLMRDAGHDPADFC